MNNVSETLRSIQFSAVLAYPLICLGIISLAIIFDKFYVYWRYIRLQRIRTGAAKRTSEQFDIMAW